MYAYDIILYRFDTVDNHPHLNPSPTRSTHVQKIGKVGN